MVLGEVLPDDMYTLLMTDFQLRHNLALRLIDLFGGHIYHVIEVLPQRTLVGTFLIPCVV